MKNFRLLSFSLWAIAASFALVSCQQDDTDTEVVTPDPVNTDTTDTNTCSGLISFNDGPVTMAPNASAYIFTPSCADVTMFPDSNFYYYVIAADNFNWGLLGPTVGYSANGLTGVEFASYYPIQVNTIYQPLGNIDNSWTSMFYYQGMGMVATLPTENVGITISEAGDEVGENIAGLITGYISDPSNPSGPLEYFEAEFCVPIASVCN
jgi:hypothetical protein